MFNVLLLRFERVGRLGKIVGRRIGTEFVKHAEREISARLDEQDNDRQAHNPALRIPRFVIRALR
jgi:hypothetical protein